MSLQSTMQTGMQEVYPLRVLNRLWNQNPVGPYKASLLAEITKRETGVPHSPEEIAMTLKNSGEAKRVINEWGEKGWVPCESPTTLDEYHIY